MKKIDYMVPGAEPDKWHVLVVRRVNGMDVLYSIVGTRTGKPFKSEEAAEKRADKIERDTTYSAYVVPVSDEYTTDEEN